MAPVCEGFTDSRQHIPKITVKVEPPGFPETRGLTGRFTSPVAGLTMRGSAGAARVACYASSRKTSQELKCQAASEDSR
jgi:hypothetical protein